jgi:hypothetical protein
MTKAKTKPSSQAFGLQVAKELGDTLPPVVAAIDVSDGNACQLLVRDVVQAPDVDSVHLSDWRFSSDSKGSHAAVLAEVVVVLPGIEKILGQLRFPRQQAKAAFPRNGGPEAGSPADGAVAPIRALRKVEIGFELDCATVTAAMVGFQHVGSRSNVVRLRTTAAIVRRIRAAVLDVRNPVNVIGAKPAEIRSSDGLRVIAHLRLAAAERS